MCWPVGVFWAEAFPGGHIGPPLRGGGGVPNQRKIGAKTGPFQRGGTEPAPYRGRSRAVCPRRRGEVTPPYGSNAGGAQRRADVGIGPYGWLQRVAATSRAAL